MLGLKPNFAEGDVIADQYRILGVAGAGGMGVVYRAQDIHLQRTVAIKVLPTVQNARDEERFLREARTACSLDHQNIGVIYEVGTTPFGTHFIAMAFYEGASLAERLSKGPLAPAIALDLVIQAAEGLREAHRHGIVHRDIKPSNLMVSDRNMLKIVDFGLAQASSAATATFTGTTGTIAYMSPEQAMGRNVDQRTDLWSLAVTFVEMLTGRNPFTRETVPGIMFAILNDAPEGIQPIPAALQPIVYRCLAKDPNQRYSSADELIDDLKSALGSLTSDNSEGNGLRSHSATARGDARKVREMASRSALVQASTFGRRQQLVLALIIVTGIVTAAVLWYWQHRKAQAEAAISNQPHVAVLPFENIDSNPENETLSAGLMDSLTGRLSDLKIGDQSLWVVPNSEVRRLKVTDPQDALKKLNANLVVKGSIEREAEHVQLHVNLIDTNSLRQVGSVEVSDETGDLALLENETVAKLAQLMHIPATADMLRTTNGAVNPAAYESYLTALGYMQRYDKPGNLDQAVDVLKKAVATDPQFAVAFAALGEAYRLQYRVDHDPRSLEEALANCKRALELNDQIPAAYVTIGQIHESQARHDLALQEFQHALQLNPKDTSALSGLAGAYENSGRLVDAEATYKKAISLQPEDWNAYNSLARFYSRHSRIPDAVAEYKRALELTPDNAQLYSNLAAAYIDSGDAKLTGNAEQALKKSIELSPSNPAYANLGVLYMTENRPADAAAALEHALAIDSHDYMVWNDLVSAYRGSGQTQKAQAALPKAESLAEAVIAAHPQDAMARSLLAVFYAMDSKPAKAKTSIQSSLALAPRDVNVLSNVGEAYELIGERDEALKYIDDALRRGYPLDQITGTPELHSLVEDPRFRESSKQYRAK